MRILNLGYRYGVGFVGTSVADPDPEGSETFVSDLQHWYCTAQYGAYLRYLLILPHQYTAGNGKRTFSFYKEV
jgi:hypothetical protein